MTQECTVSKPSTVVDNRRSLRKLITGLIVRLGPTKPVLFAVDRRCRAFGARLERGAGFLRLRKGAREMRLADNHFAYAPYLAEHFETYYSPLIPTPDRDFDFVDYSRPGILQTYAHNGIQFELASFPEEVEYIDGYYRWYTPKPGDTVFDLGAHCGVSTYEFSKLVGPQGSVVAFEPDGVNYSLLLRNIERHQLSNVIPLRMAVSDSCGYAGFSSEGTIGSRLLKDLERASLGRVERVETITLEQAFRKWGHPEFCKIDIEGSEISVLEAAAHYLKNGPDCHFSIDTNHVVNGSLTWGRVEAILRDCGYEAESSSTGMKTTWARPRHACPSKMLLPPGGLLRLGTRLRNASENEETSVLGSDPKRPHLPVKMAPLES